MTALASKSVKLPVHRVYLGESSGPRVGRARVCVLTGRGSNSLTVLISTVLRGSGTGPGKMEGVKESRVGLVPGFSTLGFSPTLDSVVKVCGCPLKLYNCGIEYCMALCTLQCSID